MREQIPVQGEIRAMGESITTHITERIRVVLETLQQQGNISPAQTERVLARLREVQSDVNDPAAQQRVLDRLRLIQNDFRERIDPNRLFQPLIEGQIRPMRRDITAIREHAALGATVTRELAAGLERLQLSGALSVGTTT